MPDSRPILTLLSLLHEPAAVNSATRRFRDQPVLALTLARLQMADVAGPTTVLCWDDQSDAVRSAVAGQDFTVSPLGPRTAIPTMDAVTAARRWSDGWRSGPLGAGAFDLGFNGAHARAAAEAASVEAILLVDPAAGWVDPALVADIAGRWLDKPDLDYAFTNAATGLGAILLGKKLLDRLAEHRTHPGRLLAYFPDQPSREPTSADFCVPAPTPAARSIHRFTLSSDRQIAKLSAATAGLGDDASAEQLAVAMAAADAIDPLPREVVLELTSRRLTVPIFSPLAAGPIDRPDLDLAVAERVIDELAGIDDVRLTLAGVGDPLLHPRLLDIVRHAASRGVAVNVETDLLVDDPALIDQLGTSPADVISVHVPALSESTYEKVMGTPGYAKVMQNVQRLVTARAAAGRGTPLVIPVFAKCEANLHEMESWYDQWLRAVGTAVIVGPTTFGGLIPSAAAADLTPPRRVPCRRLQNRLTVLCDGRHVTCEQDPLGRQSLGRARENPLAGVWQSELGDVRKRHADGRWNELPTCADCREWHRP